jgi:protein-disulfide isomerase
MFPPSLGTYCILDGESFSEGDFMSKQFLGIIAAIIIVFVGIIAFGGKKSEAPGGGKSTAAATQHFKGNEKSTVTLTEYGDFQCPYCKQYEPTIQQVVATNKDKIRFQFRNFPIVNIHQNAFAAARAAEAAAAQNKYWEMHDALYETANWQSWTNSTGPTKLFESYAQQLGMNVEQFKKDFASSKVNSAVNADIAAGNDLGVTGTPTFFLNGKKIDVGNDPQAFQKVIDEALAKTAPKETKSESTTPAAP